MLNITLADAGIEMQRHLRHAVGQNGDFFSLLLWRHKRRRAVWNDDIQTRVERNAKFALFIALETVHFTRIF